MLNKFKEDPFGHSLEILLALNLVTCVQAICLHPVSPDQKSWIFWDHFFTPPVFDIFIQNCLGHMAS